MNVPRMNIQCCSLPSLPSLLLFLLIIVLAASCSQTAFNSNNGSDGKDDPERVEERNPGDDRPTDEGEGLPGYLVDPEAIVVAFSDSGDRATVAAPKETVAGAAVKTYDLELSVWQIDGSDLMEQLSSSEEVLRFPADLLFRIPIKSDGSFHSESSFDLNPEKPLIFSVDRKGSSKNTLVIPLDNRPTAVYRQPGEGQSIDEFKTTVQLKRDDQIVLECIENWNDPAFPKGVLPEYKTIVGTKADALIPPVIRREYGEDEERTTDAALVLVKQRGTILNGFMELKNPNGWYCLDFEVTAIVTLDIAGCNRSVDKSHLKVTGIPNMGVNVIPGCD